MQTHELYIMAFYEAALYDSDMSRWNQMLPRLYERDTTMATAGIGLHFATGFLGLGAYYFTLYYWDPAILRWLSIG